MREKRTDQVKYVIIAAIVGFLLGVAVVLVASKYKPAVPYYQRSIVVLQDPNCDICAPDLNRVVRFLENNVGNGKIRAVWLDVTRGDGAKIYSQLREANANLVPLILFSKDLEGSKFFEELNKALAAQGGLRANVIRIGSYYVLRPMWPTRRYIPGVPEKIVDVWADKNYNVNGLKRILYLAADNVVVKLHDTTDNDVILRVKAPRSVIHAISPYFPLARTTSDEIEVPRVKATILARPEFAKPIESRLMAAGVQTETNTAYYGTYVLANIITAYPDIVGKILPGAHYYANGLSITREEQANLDVFISENENQMLDELNKIVTALGNRITITPHYVVGVDATGLPIMQGGQKAFQRAAAEYCAYLVRPNRWLAFAEAYGKCTSGNCVEEAAEAADLNAQAVKQCVENSDQLLSFFVNDTARYKIVKTSVLIDGWLYVDEPGMIEKYLCAMISFPPKKLCGG